MIDLTAPDPVMKARCDLCLFWSQRQSIRGTPTSKGMCRRYPPTPHYPGGAYSVVSIWPETETDDFCGEFNPRW